MQIAKFNIGNRRIRKKIATRTHPLKLVLFASMENGIWEMTLSKVCDGLQELTIGSFAKYFSYATNKPNPARPKMRGTRTRAEDHGNGDPAHVKAIMTALELAMTRKLPLDIKIPN